MAGALLVAGAAAGVLAGLLGVGGGIVIVPALFHLFGLLEMAPGISMHVAVATSLSTIIATSLSSMRAHHRRGAVDWGLMRSWAPAIAVGVIAGAVVAGFASGAVLTGVFATVALLVAANMVLTPDGLRLADAMPRGALKAVLGFVIGVVSSLMGIGGGTLSVPIMTLSGFPIRRAVGTASAIGLVIAVPGTIGYMVAGWGNPALPPLSLGFVNLLGFLIIVPMTVLAAPFGARIAHTINPRWLRAAFAVFLGLTSLRMYWTIL